MLADLFAWINGHYLTLLLLMLAGACLTLAGMLFVFIVRRSDVLLGEPDAPTFVPPTVQPPALPPKSHIRREDDDTQVITPRIPGATPELDEFLAAVDEATVAIAAMTGMPTEMLAPPGASAWEAFEQIEGLRVIPTIGPVCPFCGAPFHAVCPSAPKSGSENDVTQVVDLCPLTTQDIAIPADEPLPFHRAAVEHRSRRHETQDLTVNLAEILERERVA